MTFSVFALGFVLTLLLVYFVWNVIRGVRDILANATDWEDDDEQ